MDVPEDRYIYFATEDAGIDVPIVNKHKMCRNGCCTTCAAKVLEGKVCVRMTVSRSARDFCAVDAPCLSSRGDKICNVLSATSAIVGSRWKTHAASLQMYILNCPCFVRISGFIFHRKLTAGPCLFVPPPTEHEECTQSSLEDVAVYKPPNIEASGTPGKRVALVSVRERHVSDFGVAFEH